MKAFQSIGVLFVVLASVFSAQGQEATEPEDPPKPQYIFPTKRERFDRYVSGTVGPVRLFQTGLAAGINQWNDNPEEWGQGTKGYGRRFASSFGRNAIQQTVTYGLDTALTLDTGFKKSTREGFFPRLKDALAQNITSRTKSGKRVVSVPRLAAVYVGGVVPAETWYPSRYTYKDGLRRGTNSLLIGFGFSVLREFVIPLVRNLGR